MRYKLLVVMTMLCLIAAMGFAVKNIKFSASGSKSPALAHIGTYRLSADDYMYRTQTLSSGQLKTLESPDGKRRLLKQLIDEEILLQEAQRLDLDKDPKFMKTIESYWKQTLITLLINRRNQEVLSGLHIYQRDREEFYKAMLYAYELRIFEFASAKDAEMFRKAYTDTNENYADIKELLHDSGWNRYNYEEIDPDFRGAVQAKAAGIVVETGDRFSFVVAKRVAARNLEPMESIRESIDNLIREEKFRQAQKEWQDRLKAATPVLIVEENLKELNPVRKTLSSSKEEGH